MRQRMPAIVQSRTSSASDSTSSFTITRARCVSTVFVLTPFVREQLLELIAGLPERPPMGSQLAASLLQLSTVRAHVENAFAERGT